MTNPNAPISATIGSGCVDVYPQFGDVAPGHIPGGKVSWQGNGEAERFNTLLEGGADVRFGGDALNVAAYLATGALSGTVRFVSVRGDNSDRSSRMIGEHLHDIGVDDRSVIAPGYITSASIIERLYQGSNRMAITRPRDSLGPHLSDEVLAGAIPDADLVVVASPRDSSLMQRAFDHTSERAFLSVNPGSSGYREPDVLRSQLRDRQPDLLVLNETELAALHGDTVHNPDGSIDVSRARWLAELTNTYANYVLCTLGTDGMILAGNHDTLFHPAADVSQDRVIDNLGAGDRAHGAAARALYERVPEQSVLPLVAKQTESVLLVQGAHADLTPQLIAAAR